MEKKQAGIKINEQDAVIKFFSADDLNMPFVPWLKGERGQQTFLKLRKQFINRNMLLFISNFF